MHIFLTVFFTLFGSLLGSFCNVVILRSAAGKSVVFPPSACPKCNHRLYSIDLIPVFSWIFLLGRCRYCKEPISYQYPLVEAFSAIIVGLAFFRNGFERALVPTAAWGCIWFVVSAMHLRGEIQKPAPYAWALVYLAGLGLFAGRMDYRALPLALIAAILGAIPEIRLNDRTQREPKWIFLGAIGVISTFSAGRYAYLTVYATICFLRLIKRKYESRRIAKATNAILFLANISGIIAGLRFGFW